MTGVRSLEMLHKYGSTSRVLNLLRVWENHAREEDYEVKPLFKNVRLNRAILVKHRLRTDEEYLFQGKRKVRTKIIFPLVHGALNFGGQSIFVGQTNFEKIMRETLGGDDIEMQRDIEILRLIDSLPSFDPFLLREYLRRKGIFAADCYFDIAPSDVKKMSEFAANEVSKLVTMAFSGGSEDGVDQLVQKMVSLILSNEADEKLAPLRVALGLEGEAFKEGVFAWRGFLYFKWQMKSALNELVTIISKVDNVKTINRSDPEVKRNIEQLKKMLKDHLRTVLVKCNATMDLYNRAFDDLVVKAKAAAFREFLLSSPKLFVELGIMMGGVTHITSFWQFRFPRSGRLEIDALDFESLLLDFLHSLQIDTSKRVVEVNYN